MVTFNKKYIKEGGKKRERELRGGGRVPKE